ncbi:MAG TPA: hemolysin family protein [Tepidisphaeraceae bacterium]|jgi:CBS domain containing-hemolysin-like protein|nr:hemolysin family protein [Tepidisphaeraceae bacterium]
MMQSFWMVATLIVVALGSLVFSTLTYAIRDLSRVRFAEFLDRRGKSRWFDPVVDHIDDLILVTACWRMFFNTAIVVFSLTLIEGMIVDRVLAYSMAAILAGMVTLIFSVAVPHSLAEYAATEIVAFFAPLVFGLRIVMTPVTAGLHVIDEVVRKTAGAPITPEPEHIEQEIMSVVEEGEKEGVVDEQEREMIESVIEFRDTTAGQIMTPRTQIVAIAADATLDHVRQTIEESGHSRIPVYNETLDQIVGVLYARDLLRFLGQSAVKFDMKAVMRPPLYVPESKPSRELLRDFRLQKIHIAIILDEYSGTAGLVTIEDILEQIVGDISDEHEPVEPAMFKRINETTCDVDARIDIDEINRLTGLSIPEDGYTTLGGYISTTLGSIPPVGTVLEQNGAKFTITAAEPAMINRVKIEQSLAPVAPEAGV